MATVESAHSSNEQRQAIKESAKRVSRGNPFGGVVRGIGGFFHGLWVETGKLIRVAMIAGAVGAALGFGLVMLGYDDPVVGVKHFAAAPHCAIAQSLGMHHARYGQPGYWRHHDRDGDAIACNS